MNAQGEAESIEIKEFTLSYRCSVLGPFSMAAETRAFRWAEKSNMNKW